MNDYWKSHYNDSSKRFAGALLKQVGKTVNGYEVSEDQVRLIVDNMRESLRLSASDYVLDLCCGNGLLTRRYAPLVNQVVGVDYTQGLIDAALQLNQYQNIEYVTADVLCLAPRYLRGVSKVIMYEAIQHFTLEEFGLLLDGLSDLEVGTRFLIGSVPDKNKLKTYYDTEEKFKFHLQREAEGRPHIGRWWLSEEIDQLSSSRGFRASHLLQQRPALYTAYYRFDMILEKISCER